MTARLIAFEGGEASGKSTQAALLATRLDAVLTREPGGTPLGERVRNLLLDPDGGPVDDWAEALLMAAARAQHMAQVITPALADGRHVVTDRFSHSTLAYQGYGRGLSLDSLRDLCHWATHGRWPDLVVFLDVAPDVARSRRAGALDRLEAAGADFHDRVLDGFRTMAASDPDCWVVVDGTADPAQVAAVVAGEVAARLGLDLATG